jgi:outer membrane protein
MLFLLAMTALPAHAQSNVTAEVTGVVSNTSPLALVLTVEQAVMLALQRNPAITVEGFNPQIRRTVEAQERAAFDPTLQGQATRQRTYAFAYNSSTGAVVSGTTESETFGVSADTLLPTGTRLGVSAQTELDMLPTDDHFWGSRIGVTLTQPLLNGFGLGANLASLRQARLDTAMSQYEFRGFAEAFVAAVEGAYWDAVLAERQREIFSLSLRLAKNQWAETLERIRIGKLAALERAAAEAEVSARGETLINAESVLVKARLNLLRLVSPAESNA